MAKSRRQQLEERAARLGLTVEMWSPGDRLGTRYTFTIRAPHGGGVYDVGHALGLREAERWLEGAIAIFDLSRYDVPDGTERGRWWNETMVTKNMRDLT